jgi:hypothetical protein
MNSKYIEAYINARFKSKWAFTPLWLCLEQLPTYTINDSHELFKLLKLVEGTHEPNWERRSS